MYNKFIFLFIILLITMYIIFKLCIEKDTFANKQKTKDKNNKEKVKDNKDKVVLKFFSSFASCDHVKKKQLRICEIDKLPYKYNNKEIDITCGNDYTHAVMINTPFANISKNIPKKNRVGLAYEPPYHLGLNKSFIDYAKKNLNKYFIGNKGKLGKPFIEHRAFMWHNKGLKTTPKKDKLMSIIVTNKFTLEGNKYRHALTNEILKKKLPIDIYGRDNGHYKKKSPYYKGPFKIDEPYLNYKFHICIENTSINDYISEKLNNSLLNGTNTIYYGSKNVDKHFNHGIIKITGDLKKDIALIEKICKNPDKYYKKIDLEYMKNKIYFMRNIDTLFPN